MNKFYTEILLKLDAEINELEIETNCPLQRKEDLIQLIIQTLSNLKKFVLKRGQEAKRLSLN